MPAGVRPDSSKRLRIHTIGVSYKPIPSVVLKLDYRELDADRGSIADEFNVGFGFAL